ncbi:MAG: UDP-N-acetylmuramoyl-L-alanine--D-glutamate ligase [Chloroflexi bacterium]|nr:UDP-N-acetylmuramoyl-L-alanine--D-glutamate ligase [Chloroflexota bacterium]
MKTDWNGKRVTILGGARQGQAAARWLARHGASVTVNDHRTAEQMAAARSALDDAERPVTWVLGSHPVEILDTSDILCLSGGVPLENPIVVEAARRGIPLTNDTQVFMETVPCQTVGITGSAGKTTTTMLVGQMAKTAFGDKVYVGGNIGDPLLNYVDKMKPDDLAILEISSFQLEQMTLSPNVATVLNITPNHLDRHSTMEAYAAAKQRILNFQGNGDTAVLCREDPGSWRLRSKVNSRLISFGFGHIPGKQDGSFLADGILYLRGSPGSSISSRISYGTGRERGVEIPLLRRDQIQLRGEHNMMNALAAFAIGYAAGLPLDAMLEAAEDFRGVAHRLELVREWNGAKWYNDSIATAPERTMAAIRSFTEPIVLLLGGRDKNLPWEELAALVHERVERVVIFGEAAEKIAAALEQAHGPRGSLGSSTGLQKTVERCKDLEEAVQAAARVTEPGEVVLLSPGGTSFDQFRDFEERGEAFRKWVSELS